MAVSVEKRVLINRYGKWLWVMRQQPWHAAYWLSGIALPPHERLWMRFYFGETKQNLVTASRGTSKSFTHASLAAPLKAVLFKNIGILTLSASGFRGGKELFKDAERLFLGQLKSQIKPGSYLERAVKGSRVIQKDPSIWTINVASFSKYSTAPTNNPEQLRGLRANELVLDEANSFDSSTVEKIFRPIMNVGGEFRRTAAAGDKNKMYEISTIDLTIRDWWQKVAVHIDLQKRQHQAYKARKRGDWAEYRRIMGENDGQLRSASFSLTRVDYTDLVIPERVVSYDGERRFHVEYPCDPGIEKEDILKWVESWKSNLYMTYPVDIKGLEEPVRNGTVDLELWLAEQRNVPISSSGNVFEYELIQRVAERPVWSSAETPSTKKKRKSDDEDDVSKEEYYAPVLWSCGDPCVLGVDYARESDETTFVVIRLGELAEGAFDPFVHNTDSKQRPMLGKTEWNHICWAESWKHMQAGKAAKTIREMNERYNILYTVDIRGIALDGRGGGFAVRDELGDPKPDVREDGSIDPNWNANDVIKIFDPDDIGDAETSGFGHLSSYNDPTRYAGSLRLLRTTNQDNLDWTYAARAMMQQKKLFIGFWRPPSQWCFEQGLVNPGGEPDTNHPEYAKWIIGYNGIRRLKMQLLRLQRKVTETGVQRFVMPGDRTKEEGKKDLWAAMIYAVSLAREHLVSLTKDTNLTPMVEPVVVTIGGGEWGGSAFNPMGGGGGPDFW